MRKRGAKSPEDKQRRSNRIHGDSSKAWDHVVITIAILPGWCLKGKEDRGAVGYMNLKGSAPKVFHEMRQWGFVHAS